MCAALSIVAPPNIESGRSVYWRRDVHANLTQANARKLPSFETRHSLSRTVMRWERESYFHGVGPAWEAWQRICGCTSKSGMLSRLMFLPDCSLLGSGWPAVALLPLRILRTRLCGQRSGRFMALLSGEADVWQRAASVAVRCTAPPFRDSPRLSTPFGGMGYLGR
jgi:hypothetical protein